MTPQSHTREGKLGSSKKSVRLTVFPSEEAELCREVGGGGGLRTVGRRWQGYRPDLMEGCRVEGRAERGGQARRGVRNGETCWHGETGFS